MLKISFSQAGRKVQFLALILTTKINQVRHEHDMVKSHDLQEVLNEMKTIREVHVEDKRKKFVRDFRMNVLSGDKKESLEDIYAG